MHYQLFLLNEAFKALMSFCAEVVVNYYQITSFVHLLLTGEVEKNS